MSRAAGTFAVAIVVAIGLAGCGGSGSPASKQNDYVKGNTSVLESLPAYPSAKLKTTTSTAYTTGGGSGVAGYQTHFVYGLPAKATVTKVEGFYLKNLAGHWKQVASLTGPVLNYRNGDAFISLDLTSVRTHTLVIVVDHSFFSHIGK